MGRSGEETLGVWRMELVDYTICGLAVVIFASWSINWLTHVMAIVYA